MDDRIKITFNNMEPSDALKEYLNEKILKHKSEHLLEKMTMAEVHLTENVHAKGVDKDFQLDINVDVPGNRVHVEAAGSDMYALVDEATDKLFRVLQKNNDKQKKSEGSTPWRVLEAEAAAEAMKADVDDDDEYAGVE
ncbi:MAG: ribosome-associated translation inhibitor RaiA [Candidatus Dojkabacteria bacterium]|nr:MAG: ribosome-associated translation inhibitor RaiA [Candidatus Dojkabacteria bacterium]